jgi:hypothetical protein
VTWTTKPPTTLADLPSWLEFMCAIPVLPQVGHSSATLVRFVTTPDYGRFARHSNRTDSDPNLIVGTGGADF